MKRFIVIFGNIGLRILSRTYFLFIIPALLAVYLNSEHFVTYFSLPFVSGWDGAGHATIAEYYAKNIFPSVWGWIPNWYAGLPFPQFYPPLFYFALALLSKIWPFSFTILFKIFVSLMTLIIPGIIGWFTKQQTKNIYASWFAVFLALLYICSFGAEGAFGMSIQSVMNNSLVTQTIGFILLVPWIYYFLNIEESIRARYISAILLFFIYLSNVHIVVVTAVIFLTAFVVKFFYLPKSLVVYIRHLKLYFLLGFVPLLCASFWYIPMLGHYTFFVTNPLHYGPKSLILSWIHLIFFSIAAIIIGIVEKKPKTLIIPVAGFVILFLGFINLTSFAGNLPFHVARWFGVIHFLSIIVVAEVVAYISSYLHIKWRPIFFIVMGIFFISVSFANIKNKNFDGFYLNYKSDNFEDILEYAAQLPGLVTIEMNTENKQPVSFDIDAMLGASGVNTTWTILRESSISSPFLTPIRNSFSQNGELWGITSFLAFDYSFTKQNFEKRLELAQLAGIQNFLVWSPELLEHFTESKNVALIKDFGKFQLYSLIKKTDEVTVLSHQPILLFAPLDFKDRNIDSYDYARFQEELLVRGRNDIVLTSPRNNLLDETSDLDIFQSAVISEYKYKNIDKAFDRLSRYSLGHHLYLMEDEDELFKKLAELSIDNSHQIHIFPRVKVERPFSDPLRTQMKEIFSEIEKGLIETSSSHAVDMKISSQKISISFKTKPKDVVPVLIKKSYFPTWERAGGKPVYLASPSFILTFADDDFSLEFKKSSYVYIGYMVSFIGLLLAIIIVSWKSNKIRDIIFAWKKTKKSH